MIVNSVLPINFKANPTRKLTPLIDYKGPILDLMFYEQDEINILEKQIAELEKEVSSITRILNVKKKLTGYKIKKYKWKLFFLGEDINKLRDKIRDIKINRFNIQKAASNVK